MGKLKFIQDQAVLSFISRFKKSNKQASFMDLMIYLPEALRPFMHFYSQSIKNNGKFIGCNFYYCEDTLRYRIELVFIKAVVEVRPFWTQRLGLFISRYYDFAAPIHINGNAFPNNIKENLKKEV